MMAPATLQPDEYHLGPGAEERARLIMQGDVLESEARSLLDRIAPEPGSQQVRAALVARGVATDVELDAHIDAARRGALDIATSPHVTAWGRRPGGGGR